MEMEEFLEIIETLESEDLLINYEIINRYF